MTKLKHGGPVVVLSAVITLFVGAAALATPPTDAVSTSLARGSFGQLQTQHDGVEVNSGNANADVAFVEATLEPGGSTGWHHHPGVGLASVASGTVAFYNDECDKTVYEAGEGFYESHEPMLVRNEGNVDAVFYVTFIVPSSTPTEGLRIDDPQPENCDPLAAADGTTSSLADTGGDSLAAPFALAAALLVVAGGAGVVALTLLGRRSAG
jgi:quercetin dioxygenase-like cupin family protein